MSQSMPSKLRFAIAALSLLGLTACADLSPTQQRMLSGGSIGSAVGIGVTVLTGGCIPCGGSIGSIVGTGLGYAFDDYMDGKPPKK